MKYLVLSTLMFLSHTGFAGKPGLIYLGITPFYSDCVQWTKDAGYKTVRYGGYINNTYRPDACFASDPIDSSSSSEEALKSDIHFSQVQSKVLYLKLQADKGYDSLLSRAEKLENSLDVLYAAASDGVSKTSLDQFYRDTKFAYEMLTYDYYPVHVKEQNSSVAEAWKVLVTSLEKLKKDFES